LTLQNGLNNVDVLCEKVQAQHVIAGATYESAWLEGEGKVQHTGSGPTRFGAWTACATKAAEEAFSRAGFAIEPTNAPGQAIWERVTVCAGVEPLTALLRVTNGQLVELREARQLLRDLVVEAAKVAAVEGYRFDFSLVERAEQFCNDAVSARSPMLADVESARRTEIEQIGGEILARAERAGLPAPRTRVIWQLLTSLQHS
jgi:2-dehydropantoate 2-reductase